MYEKEQIKEKEEFDGVVNILETATSKKPIIESTEITKITSNSVSVKIKATSEEDKMFTYKIYIGTEKDKLIEKQSLEEKQGIDVTLTVTDLQPETQYFYRIEVIDEKQVVSTEVEIFTTLINHEPQIVGTIKQTEKTANTFTIQARATDEDGDKLIYKVYIGNSKTEQTTLGKTSDKSDSGNTVTLSNIAFTKNTACYYRVDVSDGYTTVSSKVYCPGTGYECVNTAKCSTCNAKASDGGQAGLMMIDWINNYSSKFTITSVTTTKYTNNITCKSCNMFSSLEGLTFYKAKCKSCPFTCGFWRCPKCNKTLTTHTTDTLTGPGGAISPYVFHKCHTCNGTGRTKCSAHGIFGSHIYCSHSKTAQHEV